jgi:hypothetical protein
MASHDFWGILHDGLIIDLSGTVPGSVTAVIRCQYLRDKFTPPGHAFRVILPDCQRFEYEPFDEPAITALAEVASRKPMILYCATNDLTVELDCVDGRCRITHGDHRIELDDGTPVSDDELAAAAQRYWSEWEAANNRD